MSLVFLMSGDVKFALNVSMKTIIFIATREPLSVGFNLCNL